MAKNNIGTGQAIICCEECGKIIGVDYAAGYGAETTNDCYCLECHNKEEEDEE